MTTIDGRSQLRKRGREVVIPTHALILRFRIELQRTDPLLWREIEVLGDYNLQLVGDAIDDEIFLRICRETGRRRDLVEKLLDLSRFDEAEAEVRLADDSELLTLADLLREQGHAERAEHLVREHQPAPQWQDRYDEWRRERARERGDIAAALALSTDCTASSR